MSYRRIIRVFAHTKKVGRGHTLHTIYSDGLKYSSLFEENKIYIFIPNFILSNEVFIRTCIIYIWSNVQCVQYKFRNKLTINLSKIETSILISFSFNFVSILYFLEVDTFYTQILSTCVSKLK